MAPIQLRRLRFHIWKLRERKEEISEQEKDELLESLKMIEQEPMRREWEQMMEEVKRTAPALDLRKTMLFVTCGHEKRCCFLTAGRCRKKIQMAYQEARAQGVDTFLVDDSVPFGLLAAETLCKMRNAGEKFHLYLFRTKEIGHNKSYRLIPETDIERIMLRAQVDYIYHDPCSDRDWFLLLARVRAICNERHFRVKKLEPSDDCVKGAVSKPE